MNKNLFNLMLYLLLVMSVSSCTTTTKLVSREVSVDQAVQVDNAKIAFSEKNYVLAAKLLKPLAEQGRGDAQYALGYLYFNGFGVPRDKSLAAQWFNSAAANGNENAKQALRHLPSPDSVVIDLRDKKEPLSEPIMELTDESEITKDTPAGEAVTIESKVDQSAKIEESSDAGVSHNGEKITDGEKWIAAQPSNNFTIQLIVLADEPALQKFINENNLQDNSVYYRIQENGKVNYALIHGSFESYSLAKESADNFSSDLNIENPWIRNISNVQELLSTH